MDCPYPVRPKYDSQLLHCFRLDSKLGMLHAVPWLCWLLEAYLSEPTQPHQRFLALSQLLNYLSPSTFALTKSPIFLQDPSPLALYDCTLRPIRALL